MVSKKEKSQCVLWYDVTILLVTVHRKFRNDFIKDKLFSIPVPYITNLKARITDDFATITEDMLENTWRENDYQLDVLRATKGAHIEVSLCWVPVAKAP
jgi:hypothetical protein